ncbi:hypothetical protein ACIBI3_20895 [Actinomadura luteofluorescens]|uniref:hypothetical protein n=1 Tax=Actinomadura luteofluorescens TaxID=46163 RepID=UPI00347508D4
MTETEGLGGTDCPRCRGLRTVEAAALFVHGIGAQPPGHTLRTFGAPLLTRAKTLPGYGGQGAGPRIDGTIIDVRRLERHEPPAAPPASPVTRIARRLWGAPRPVSAHTWPAHEVWEVRTAEHGTVASHHWLLVESCWSRSFPLPHPLRFAVMLLLIAPWMMIFQMGAGWFGWVREVVTARGTPRSRRAGRVALASAGSYFGFAPRLLVSILVITATPLLAVLGTVPILRVPVTLLIDYVGDSVAAMADPAVRARMRAVISADLQWTRRHLPPRASCLVVAHSQGAMLTREMLAADRPGDGTVFFGLGSGLALLHGVGRALSVRTSLLGWLSATCLTLMLVLLAVAGVTSFPGFFADINATLHDPYGAGLARAFQPPDQAEQLVMVALVLQVSGGLALRASGMTALIAEWREKLRLPHDAVGHWREFTSAYDPVSCGPILDGVANSLVPVVNGPVLPAEHTGYHRNPLVQAEILAALAGSAGLWLPIGFLAETYALAERAQRRDRLIIRLSTYTVWFSCFGVIASVLFWSNPGGLW